MKCNCIAPTSDISLGINEAGYSAGQLGHKSQVNISRCILSATVHFLGTRGQAGHKKMPSPERGSLLGTHADGNVVHGNLKSCFQMACKANLWSVSQKMSCEWPIAMALLIFKDSPCRLFWSRISMSCGWRKSMHKFYQGCWFVEESIRHQGSWGELLAFPCFCISRSISHWITIKDKLVFEQC